MRDFVLEEKIEKLNKIKDEKLRLTLIWGWVKSNHITFNQFQTLVSSNYIGKYGLKKKKLDLLEN